MNKLLLKSASILLILIVSFSCKEEEDPVPLETPCIEGLNENSDVIGFGIMNRLPGIWNGPVTSPTPLGSYPEWIVDFRPISASQVSAKNELDSLNDIFMSFFVVKHDNDYKIAFRNGGGFAGAQRNSYMVIDSLNEGSSNAFYRFSDPVAGSNRVYTDVTFKDDSIIMHVFTNQFNSLSVPETHMVWKASLRNGTAKQEAISLFDYPKKELTRDFSTTFEGLSEAVFYSSASDPFPESEQPHLGVSNVGVNIINPAVIDPSKKVLIIVTTEPLFNGFQFNQASLNSRSRYVLVGAQSLTGYDFNYMHPGDYYVNAIYDSNGDGAFSSGDFMNSSFDVDLTLNSEGNSNVSVNIDFQIP